MEGWIEYAIRALTQLITLIVEGIKKGRGEGKAFADAPVDPALMKTLDDSIAELSKLKAELAA